MYGRLRATVNTYRNSEVAARYAVRLTQAGQAKLSLIFVAQIVINQGLSRPAAAVLESSLLESSLRGCSGENHQQKGTSRQIRGWVREKEVNQVFRATRPVDTSPLRSRQSTFSGNPSIPRFSH